MKKRAHIPHNYEMRFEIHQGEVLCLWKRCVAFLEKQNHMSQETADNEIYFCHLSLPRNGTQRTFSFPGEICWADQTKFRGCHGQRASSEKLFLRICSKLFVLTACVASMCPQRLSVAAFRSVPGQSY
jgi:hypothetical protein